MMLHFKGIANARVHRLAFLWATGVFFWAGCASLTPSGRDQAALFPRMEGWKLLDDVRTYTPETLYEYINGAAVGYLAYDFQELHVAEYRRKKQASVLVEIYRHLTPAHAFGIYSQERPREGPFLDIGAQGYCEVPLLNFIVGEHYVKINGAGDPPASETLLETFSHALVAALGGKTGLPPVLACFPEELRLPDSEMFVARNFLGYGFLHSGYTAEYRIDDQYFKLFIIEGTDRQDCQQMVESYAELTQYPEVVEEGPLHTFTDPYHGEVTLAWKGNYIWGALDLADSQERSRYLSSIETGLSKLQPDM
ncbi:MAG: hypothetical protein JSU77_13635 [Fidelibacterota bacterium]|nr:MAG: hypothetical protein JSU77_13635 [Candidatus Neomarinimicrobiota bacterium]